MGGSTTAAFIVDITGGITDMRQSLNLAVQEVRNLNQALQITKSLVGGLQLPGSGGGTSGYSGNQIAPSPKFTPPASQTTGGGGGGGQSAGAVVPYGGGRSNNIVAYTPAINAGGGTGGTGGGFTGGNNLTEFIKENPGAGALFAGAASNALFSASDTVEAQLLMQRAAYFNSAGAAGRKAAPITQASLYGMGSVDYNNIRNLQENMARTGTVTDAMDAMRSLVAAQSYGITGPNITGGAMGGVAMGVAQTSNLLPGIGAEGTMRAYGQMQQARNVNMLRGIGIRIRDEQGNLKPPDQIIDDLWAKICRDYSRAYGSDAKPSEREMLIGLQPGNSMDSMLDMYFGNDPMAKQLVANGLLFKAKTGGAKITKEKLTEMGGTTAAVNAFSKRQAVAAEGLGQVANAGAFGFEKAAQVLAQLGTFMNIIDRMTGALQVATGTNTFATTLLGSGNGFFQKILAMLLGIKGKHAGGPVEDKVPYVVGEKGPELFVPKSDGTIVPNHELKNNGFFREHGGSVDGGGHKLAGSKKALTDEQLRKVLHAAGFEGAALDTAIKIARAESGGIPGRHSDPSLLSDDSYGLFQINMLGKMGLSRDTYYKNKYGSIGYKDRNSLYDPYINAKIAYELSGKGTTWDKHWVNSSQKLGLGSGDGSFSGFLTNLNSKEAESVAAQMLSLMMSAAGAAATGNFGSLDTGSTTGGWGSGAKSSAASAGGKTVVININGATDLNAIARAVQDILVKNGLIEKAVTK